MVRRRHLYLLCFGLVALVATGAALAGSGALTSSAKADVYNYAYDGFDTCGAPTESQMNTWWYNSSYFWVGIYIGGVNRACPNTNLTSSWVTTVKNQGWAFAPIYVGLQDPCYGGSTFSTNTTTAKSEGAGSADNAAATASNLGFGGGAVIYYDLEGFGGTSNSTCDAAAKAFSTASIKS